MYMFKKILTLSVVTVFLTSCGERSEKVETLKRGDKNLSCPEVQLEINEAEQYKKMAYDKQRLGIKSIVMPLGYIDTYMSADEAVQAAEARIQYLNKIFEIKRCDPVNTDMADSDIQNSIQQAMQPQLGGGGGGQIPVTYGYPQQYQQPQPYMYPAMPGY